MLNEIDLKNAKYFTKYKYNKAHKQQELFVSNEIKKDIGLFNSNLFNKNKKTTNLLVKIAKLNDEDGKNKNNVVLTIDDIEKFKELNADEQKEFCQESGYDKVDIDNIFIKFQSKNGANFRITTFNSFKYDVDGKIGDFEQGYIGDCFLLSSIYAVAKAKPEIIKNSIKRDFKGNYNITFKGLARTIKVTPKDFKKASNYSTGDPDVKVLEIAYAKYMASKGKDINNGGLSEDALKILTDKTPSASWRNEFTSFFSELSMKDINKALTYKGKYALTASVGDWGDYKKIGLLSDHTYVVKNVYKKGKNIYIDLVNPYDTSIITTLNKKEFHKYFNKDYANIFFDEPKTSFQAQNGGFSIYSVKQHVSK